MKRLLHYLFLLTCLWLPNANAECVKTGVSVEANSQLDKEFAKFMVQYVNQYWQDWAPGQKIGECLGKNAAAMTTGAKEGVMKHGVESAFAELSDTDFSSLDQMYARCEQGGSQEQVTVQSNCALDQAFAIAVKEYIATNWASWTPGEQLGECLAANASLIADPAKQGVIDYGLEQVYDHISQTDSHSLSTVWSDCETVTTSSKAEIVAAAAKNRPDALTFVPSTAYGSFPGEIEAAFKATVDTEFSAALEKAGISVAVFTDNMLWTYASGIASSTAEMTPNTPSRIWSSSKVFLGALILNQIEQGLYELSDSLESVLSDHPDYSSIDPAIYNPAVTVEEMLRMRSGTAERDKTKSTKNVYSIYSNPTWKPADMLGLIQDPWVEPGSFSYANLNSTVLGLIAEHHGGQNLNFLYRDTLFKPLGITVGLTPRDGVPLDAARPYLDLGPWGEYRGLDLNGFGDRIEAEIAAGWEDDPRDWHTGQGRITWAAAGMFTTAENMARWAYELFSPNGSAISEFNRTALLNSFGTELVDIEGRLQYYGYHATKSEVILEGGTVVTAYGHPGGGAGWDGNFVSKLAYSPELNLSVSVLTNSPLLFHGACPDHSADESQRLGPQLCVIQEIFGAYASAALGDKFGG